MSERNRSSDRRVVASASSFCSMVAPAMRITKKRTNAPIRARALVWASERKDGNTCCEMPTCPMAMPSRLHRAVTRQTREPHRATFSRARKAYAPHRTGPHPLK